MAQSYPRDLAVRVLTRVLSDHEPLDEALAALGGQAASPQSRAWLQEVCSGTLRWKGRLDLAVDSTALKKKPSGWLRKILLIAAYQLIVQERVQPALVVNETVGEIKRKEGEAPARFANAALRKISDHREQWKSLALRAEAPPAEGAAWASLPEWLWSRLRKDHGVAWVEAYARASLERPVTWIRARDPEFVADSIEKGPVPGSFQLLEGGALTERKGFAEGLFIAQDISSQRLVQEIAGAYRELSGREPGRALDLCAAPGGKSVGLAWCGFEVAASDRDPARYELLSSTVRRTRTEDRIRILPRDEVQGLPPVDLVWVDAPCTGTGILRRHPDVRWLRRESELEGLLRVQQGLLEEAWSKVRPGGVLAYSVCSVIKDEGPAALEKFLAGPGKDGEQIRAWFFVPQDAPSGDGFWAGLVAKRTA